MLNQFMILYAINAVVIAFTCIRLGTIQGQLETIEQILEEMEE